MPPPKHPKQLTDVEKELLARWIRQGAEFEEHWAYARPVRPRLPEVRDGSWPRNPIDRFILDALEREGLDTSPEADRATLLRRLSLDLIGLPPTPDEVDAFLADRGQDSYETVVDRLLASPEFGVRWARPWLDACAAMPTRTASSATTCVRSGLSRLGHSGLERRHALRPVHDRAVGRRPAPSATEAQKIATGFHRCAPINVEAGSDPEETRVNQVIDRVNTTAAVWLGTTLECASATTTSTTRSRRRDYYQPARLLQQHGPRGRLATPRCPARSVSSARTMPLADARA